MSGSFSNYLENNILDHITGKTAYTKPTAYVALSTANPGEDGSTIAEPVGNGYARVATAGADWNAASGGSVSNANNVTFPEASGSWGTIAYFAVFDDPTAGNMLAYGSLSSSLAVASGYIPKFAGGTPGQLVLTLD